MGVDGGDIDTSAGLGATVGVDCIECERGADGVDKDGDKIGPRLCGEESRRSLPLPLPFPLPVSLTSTFVLLLILSWGSAWGSAWAWAWVWPCSWPLSFSQARLGVNGRGGVGGCDVGGCGVGGCGEGGASVGTGVGVWAGGAGCNSGPDVPVATERLAGRLANGLLCCIFGGLVRASEAGTWNCSGGEIVWASLVPTAASNGPVPRFATVLLLAGGFLRTASLPGGSGGARIDAGAETPGVPIVVDCGPGVFAAAGVGRAETGSLSNKAAARRGSARCRMRKFARDRWRTASAGSVHPDTMQRSKCCATSCGSATSAPLAMRMPTYSAAAARTAGCFSTDGETVRASSAAVRGGTPAAAAEKSAEAAEKAEAAMTAMVTRAERRRAGVSSSAAAAANGGPRAWERAATAAQASRTTAERRSETERARGPAREGRAARRVDLVGGEVRESSAREARARREAARADQGRRGSESVAVWEGRESILKTSARALVGVGGRSERRRPGARSEVQWRLCGRLFDTRPGVFGGARFESLKKIIILAVGCPARSLQYDTDIIIPTMHFSTRAKLPPKNLPSIISLFKMDHTRRADHIPHRSHP